MIFSKQIFTNSIKKLGATTLVGVFALFGTQALISSELHASTIVPTSYNLSELYTAMNRQIPDGYVKTNYKINLVEKNKKPSSSELSVEDAAEIMAQELFRFSKQDLSNKTLDMVYSPAATNHTFDSVHGESTDESLASWDCSLKLPAYTIAVSIDSSTGELFTIDINYPPKSDASSDNEDPRKMDPKVRKALDTAKKNFVSNKAQNLEKVKNLIIQAGYVTDPIQSVEYRYVGFDVLSGRINYHFEVTTTSNKRYTFTIYEGLTEFSEVMTDAFLK